MVNRDVLQLKDYDVIPTYEVLEHVLAESFPIYDKFQDSLANIELEQNWQWYVPHKAWYAKGQYFWMSRRGIKKEKVIYWLFVYQGHFNIEIWFKEINRAELLKADISERTKKIISNSESKMRLSTFPISFDIQSSSSLLDIYILIDFKKKLECK